MATANIKTPDGTTIRIQGTAEEITAVVQRLKDQAVGEGRGKKAKGKPGGRPGLGDLIDSLIEGGHFNKPVDLAAVRHALEEMGHHYPNTTLSPALLRIVRQRRLRRIKKDKRWHYTR